MLSNQVVMSDLRDLGGGNSVGGLLMANNMDYHCLRPFRDLGKTWINRQVVNSNGELVLTPVLATNATGVLTPYEWIELDQMIMTVARPRLKLVADLRGTPGLEKRIQDGMATTVLQHQIMSDVGEAIVSMSPGRSTRTDRPVFDTGSLPLPVTHSDIEFDIRQLATSRRSGLGGLGWDLSNVEQATRRVAEKVERLAIGLESYAYGGGTAYGLINFPSRVSYSMTLPTASSWTPATCVDEILAMMQASRNINRFGPWSLYTSLAWTPYLDADYSAAKSEGTLRDRILRIGDLQSVVSLDYMTGYRMVLVEKSSNTVQMVVGMEMTPVQWQVGMNVWIKVMTIQVPRVRADHNSSCGIVDGLAA